LGLPHPRTILLRDAEAFEEIPDDRLPDFFVKPHQSSVFSEIYGAKALRVRNRTDALRLFGDASSKGLTVMLQEFIPGPPTHHAFVEGFVDRRGRICGLLARRRMRMFPEEFGNSTFCVTIPLLEVGGAVETIKRLVAGIGYWGVFSAEFKLDDRDGVFKLLEVNARPWWYVDFAARCGLDVCQMAYFDALGAEIEPVTTYQVGRRCILPHLDLVCGLAERSKGSLSGWSLVRSWLGAYQPMFSWEDPLPGLVDLSSRIAKRAGWRLGP
jgi:D-aspartate ligase